MQLQYLSVDRPGCQFSAKELCRFMAKLIKLTLKGLKRLGRHLGGQRRLVYMNRMQKQIHVVKVYADIAHA